MAETKPTASFIEGNVKCPVFNIRQETLQIYSHMTSSALMLKQCVKMIVC